MFWDRFWYPLVWISRAGMQNSKWWRVSLFFTPSIVFSLQFCVFHSVNISKICCYFSSKFCVFHSLQYLCHDPLEDTWNTQKALLRASLSRCNFYRKCWKRIRLKLLVPQDQGDWGWGEHSRFIRNFVYDSNQLLTCLGNKQEDFSSNISTIKTLPF